MSDDNYEAALWEVLERGQLSRLSQFHQPRFFEEVPLYTRLSDIAFLSKLSTSQQNAVLLKFSLKFLKSVISYEEHRTPYFAAISVWRYADDEPIVPNLFVWSDLLKKLYDKLTLREAKTRFGKSITRIVSHLRLPDPLEIFEDVETTPELTRLFIGPSLPPYPSFVPSHAFLKPLASVKS